MRQRMPLVALLTLIMLITVAFPSFTTGTAEADVFAQEVIERTNIERASRGLSPLKQQDQLQDAAMWLAQDMADYNYVNHTDRLGRIIEQRFPAFGYTSYTTIGENIAAGYGSAEAALNGWMTSNGHRNTILGTNYCEIGAGYGFNTASQYNRYWVQTFGCRAGVYPVVINNEAARTTNAQVDLYVYGSEWAQEMRLSNDGVNWTAWEPFITVRSWTLTEGTGPRTVYVQLRNGGVIRAAQDLIELIGPPATPLDLHVQTVTAHSVTLSWRSAGSNATGFRVYRWAMRDEVWEFYPYADISVDSTEFTDSGLDCAGEYFYLLTAFNAQGESLRTGWVRAQTSTCPPTNTPTATATSTATATATSTATATTTATATATATTSTATATATTATTTAMSTATATATTGTVVLVQSVVYLPLLEYHVQPATPTPVVMATPTVIITPTSTSVTPLPTTPSDEIAGFEQEVIRLTNRERTSRGLTPLRESAILTRAARDHNEDMIRNNFAGHQGSDGSWPSDRGCRLGYKPYGNSGCFIAENISFGQTSPATVVEGWMNSTGHRGNILDPNSREIGLAYNRGGSWGHYWTMTLGVQPEVFPIFINNDDPETTSRTVTITLTHEGIAEWLPFGSVDTVYISEDPTFAGALPQAWSQTIPFTLSSESGVKTVYVQLVDEEHEVISSDTIEVR